MKMDLSKLNEKISALSTEIEIREAKIKFLKENGIIPFVERYERSHTIKEALSLDEGSKVKIAGRIIFRRIMGKFGFLKIQDIEGAIQVSVGRNELDEDAYEFYKKLIDLGDFIGVEGELYRTQTGELTVKANNVQLLSKAMRPLPEKFHGLTDMEIRYRQRYLDLISNEESRKVMLGRCKMTSFIRKYLGEHGFLEVETPILQNAVCGASAKPFYTKHNALNKMFNLRIAPEISLKEVICAGFDRVFEIGKVFRNEGMDPQHLQEFTMCEWYVAYWNFEDNVKFFKEFIRALLQDVLGTTKLIYQGTTIDFGAEWERVDYTQKMHELLGFDFLDYEDRDKFVKRIVKTKMFNENDFEGIKTVGGVIDYIYKRKIRPDLIRPTVLFNYPACLVPLARRNDKDSRIIDMFQVLAIGSELCKAYSELVDPIIQREAFEEQLKAKKAGDDEAMDLDEDFLLSMEHGMPPISGLGFGLDRLMVVMFNQESVRDVVLFPLMK
jgi:lysyl-tRNA synthetase class 2